MTYIDKIDVDGTEYDIKDSTIPSASASDSGKVITVDSNGDYTLAIASGSSDLGPYYGTATISSNKWVVTCSDLADNTDFDDGTLLICTFDDDVDFALEYDIQVGQLTSSLLNIYEGIASVEGILAAGTPGILIYNDSTGWVCNGTNDYYDDSDSWRNLTVDGSSWKGIGTTTGAANFVSGSNITLTASGNDLTIAASGVASQLGTSDVGGGTNPIYLSSGTATASSSTVGSSTQPVYLNAGTITAITGSIANDTTGNAATATTATTATTLGSSTVGGAANPIYLSSGTATACSSTVGGTAKPVYMNSGTITACSSTVGSTDRPSYMSSGTMTQCNTPASGSWFQGVPYVSSAGVMEVGRYIDFHPTSASTLDYSKRIDAGTGTTARVLSLPDSAGYLSVGSTSGVGSSTQPMYMSSSGVLTAITGSIANSTTGNAATATTATTATNATNIYAKSGSYKTVANTLLEMVYPVGSVYISTSSTSPASFLGGTWTQIKGRFLLGVGANTVNTVTTYGSCAASTINRSSVKEQGGEASNTLVINNYQHGTWRALSGSGDDISDAVSRGSYYGFKTYSQSTSNNTAHNNMPPYFTVYMWYRAS